MNAARWVFVGGFVAFMHFVAGYLFRMAYLGVPEAIKEGGLEAQVRVMEMGQQQIADLLERVLPSTTEQLDGLRAAVEALRSQR